MTGLVFFAIIYSFEEKSFMADALCSTWNFTILLIGFRGSFFIKNEKLYSLLIFIETNFLSRLQ